MEEIHQVGSCDVMTYLWHQGLGDQVGIFCLSGLVQVLVGSSNIHVGPDVICVEKRKITLTFHK